MVTGCCCGSSRLRVTSCTFSKARVYPALYRLEHQGLIASEWGESENKRKARYYRLTAAGRKRFKEEVGYLAPVFGCCRVRAQGSAGGRMTLLTQLRSWMRAVLHRDALEDRMKTEMETHLALYEADLRRGGLSADEARTRARAGVRRLEARKDECREALGLRIIDELRGDVRYALRLLRRSPVVHDRRVLSLGFGIGANTAIFTLVDTVLLKSLPVKEPSRLFFVDNSGGKSGGSNGPPYPCFEMLRDHNRYFSGHGGVQRRRAST